MDHHRLDAALIAYFKPEVSAVGRMHLSDLDDLLSKLQQQPKAIGSLLEHIQLASDLAPLSPIHQGRLGLVDLCFTQIINQGAYPPEIRQRLLCVVALIARYSLHHGFDLLTEEHISIRILESLMELSAGYCNSSDRAEQLMQSKFDQVLETLVWLSANVEESPQSQHYLLELLNQDVGAFLVEERGRMARLERHMIEEEILQVKVARSKHHAAVMINQKMADKIVPEPVVQFLQGPWFESVQLVVLKEGKTGDTFYRVSKLTETLILIMQPENSPGAPPNKNALASKNASTNKVAAVNEVTTDHKFAQVDRNPLVSKNAIIGDKNGFRPGFSSQEFYRIIEHLPDELNSALAVITQDNDAADQALAPVEQAIVDLMKGDVPAAYQFKLLATLPELLSKNTRVSKTLLAPVQRLKTDQWFVQSMDDQSRRHIKLTLKNDELEHLLFTRLDGAKMLEVSYADFAYLLSSEQIKPLLSQGDLVRNLRNKLKKLLQWHQKRTRGVKVESNDQEVVGKPPVCEPDASTQVQNSVVLQAKKIALENIASLVIGTSLLINQKARLEPGSESDLSLEGGLDGGIEAKVAVIDPFVDRIVLVDLHGGILGEFQKARLAEMVVMGFCRFLESDNQSGKEHDPIFDDRFRLHVMSLIQGAKSASVDHLVPRQQVGDS